jgi:hypothetical protein
MSVTESSNVSAFLINITKFGMLGSYLLAEIGVQIFPPLSKLGADLLVFS